MPQIDKRGRSYRARYYDPLGRRQTKSFVRKADAERFLREMKVEMDRGHWLDPRDAEMPVAEWAEEFLSLARRLSTATQQTYRRDIDKYILPRFGPYKIGRLPADEIENWLNDEIEAGYAPSSVHRHYRTFRRMLQVAVEKEKVVANPFERVEPPQVPTRETVFLTWRQALDLAKAHRARYRALIYLAVDSGMRWSELIGLRQSRLDMRHHKVRVTDQLIRLDNGEWLRKEPKTAGSVRSITISGITASVLADHLDRFANSGPDGSFRTVPVDQSSRRASGMTTSHRRPREPMSPVDFTICGIPASLLSSRRCTPEGDPNADGSLVDQRDTRPLWPPVPRTRRCDRDIVQRTARRGADRAVEHGRPRGIPHRVVTTVGNACRFWVPTDQIRVVLDAPDPWLWDSLGSVLTSSLVRLTLTV
jgi:integrase